MGIKHKRTAAKADGPDDGRVQPSWWNDDHEIGDFLSAIIGLALTPNTLPYIKADQTAGLAALSDFVRGLLSLADAATVLGALGAAPLASPAFTNTPTAPTPALGTNTAQIATMAALQAMRADLVNSSPATLDTLNELATALGDDPNFATTMTNALAARLRFDAAQTLTTGQKAQAIANLALAAVAASGAYADLTGRPTLGTAAALDVGTAANNVVKLDGSAKLPAVDGAALTNLTSSGAGLNAFAGYFQYTSATAVALVAERGALLKINGVGVAIPGAGVSAANTGVFVNGVSGQNLAINTLYYVYAFLNSGVLTLDFSTTAYVTSTTAGNIGTPIKSGDDTRTHVGLVYTNASAQFTQSNVASFLNRKYRSVTASASVTTAGISNNVAQVDFVTYADHGVDTNIQAMQTNVSASAVTVVQLMLDGVQVGMTARNDVVAATGGASAALGGKRTLTTGRHTVGMYLNMNGTPSAGNQETFVSFWG